MVIDNRVDLSISFRLIIFFPEYSSAQSYEASNIGEPCAGKPLAGVWEGAVRKLTVPTSHNKKIKYKIGNKLLNEIYKKLSIEPIKWKYLIYEKKN